jgi:hypothetical protein
LAKVVQIDRSIQPWGYGIELEGNPDIRFTEGNRLLPQHMSSDCLQQGWFTPLLSPVSDFCLV